MHDALRSLLAETNDQRRRFGQTIYHFYRTLGFWHGRGKDFAYATRAFAPAGAQLFESMATHLRELTPHQEDVALRQFAQGVFAQLADDLERGPRLLVGYMRWLEGRFPLLTRLMQAESPTSRCFDYALAVDLGQGLQAMAHARGVTLIHAARRLSERCAPSAR